MLLWQRTMWIAMWCMTTCQTKNADLHERVCVCGYTVCVRYSNSHLDTCVSVLLAVTHTVHRYNTTVFCFFFVKAQPSSLRLYLHACFYLWMCWFCMWKLTRQHINIHNEETPLMNALRQYIHNVLINVLLTTSNQITDWTTAVVWDLKLNITQYLSIYLFNLYLDFAIHIYSQVEKSNKNYTQVKVPIFKSTRVKVKNKNILLVKVTFKKLLKITSCKKVQVIHPICNASFAFAN